jgi:hypothetical protein
MGGTSVKIRHKETGAVLLRLDVQILRGARLCGE